MKKASLILVACCVVLGCSQSFALSPKTVLTEASPQGSSRNQNSPFGKKPVFLFLGHHGSGKSTLAEECARELNLSFVSTGDVLKEGYFGIPAQERQYITKNVILRAFFHGFEAGKGLILDMHFTEKSGLNPENPLPPYLDPSVYYFAGIVHIAVSEKTARERMVQRNREQANTQSLSDVRILRHNQYTEPKIDFFKSFYPDRFIEVNNDQEGGIPEKVGEILDRISRLANPKAQQLIAKSPLPARSA